MSKLDLGVCSVNLGEAAGSRSVVRVLVSSSFSCCSLRRRPPLSHDIDLTLSDRSSPILSPPAQSPLRRDPRSSATIKSRSIESGRETGRRLKDESENRPKRERLGLQAESAVVVGKPIVRHCPGRLTPPHRPTHEYSTDHHPRCQRFIDPLLEFVARPGHPILYRRYISIRAHPGSARCRGAHSLRSPLRRLPLVLCCPPPPPPCFRWHLYQRGAVPRRTREPSLQPHALFRTGPATAREEDRGVVMRWQDGEFIHTRRFCPGLSALQGVLMFLLYALVEVDEIFETAGHAICRVGRASLTSMGGNKRARSNRELVIIPFTRNTKQENNEPSLTSDTILSALRSLYSLPPLQHCYRISACIARRSFSPPQLPA